MHPGSNCELPNLALLDKRAHVTSSLNVNKQLEQTKTGLQVISIVVIVTLFLYRYKDIAAMSLLNV